MGNMVLTSVGFLRSWGGLGGGGVVYILCEREEYNLSVVWISIGEA